MIRLSEIPKHKLEAFKYDPLRPLIILLVEEFTKVSFDEMSAKKRNRDITFPRQLVFYLMKKHTEHSFALIGSIFDKDHSTSIHSVNKVSDIIDTERYYRTQIKKIDDEIEATKRLLHNGNTNTIKKPKTNTQIPETKWSITSSLHEGFSNRNISIEGKHYETYFR